MPHNDGFLARFFAGEGGTAVRAVPAEDLMSILRDIRDNTRDSGAPTVQDIKDRGRENYTLGEIPTVAALSRSLRSFRPTNRIHFYQIPKEITQLDVRFNDPQNLPINALQCRSIKTDAPFDRIYITTSPPIAANPAIRYSLGEIEISTCLPGIRNPVMVEQRPRETLVVDTAITPPQNWTTLDTDIATSGDVVVSRTTAGITAMHEDIPARLAFMVYGMVSVLMPSTVGNIGEVRVEVHGDEARQTPLQFVVPFGGNLIVPFMGTMMYGNVGLLDVSLDVVALGPVGNRFDCTCGVAIFPEGVDGA